MELTLDITTLMAFNISYCVIDSKQYNCNLGYLDIKHPLFLYHGNGFPHCIQIFILATKEQHSSRCFILNIWKLIFWIFVLLLVARHLKNSTAFHYAHLSSWFSLVNIPFISLQDVGSALCIVVWIDTNVEFYWLHFWRSWKSCKTYLQEVKP